MVKRWIPLESNPEVLNEFTSKLGLDTSKYSFTDVYGLDEVCPAVTHVKPALSFLHHRSAGLRAKYTQELLSMVPQPCLAVLMLFPVTADSERAKAQGMPQTADASMQSCPATAQST